MGLVGSSISTALGLGGRRMLGGGCGTTGWWCRGELGRGGSWGGDCSCKRGCVVTMPPPSPLPPATFTAPQGNKPLQSNVEPRSKPPKRAQAEECPSSVAPGCGSGHEVSLPVLPATARPGHPLSSPILFPQPPTVHPKAAGWPSAPPAHQPRTSLLHLHHKGFLPRDIVGSWGAATQNQDSHPEQ